MIRNKLGRFVKGKRSPLPDWWKKKISIAEKGKKISEETKKKISETHKGDKNPMYGKNLSEIHKKKISESNKGKKKSLNHKKNISLGRKGIEFSKKHKINLGIAQKKRFKNPEDHPNWLGGISFEPYSKSFNNKFKRLIRKRDNHVCLKCGKHQEKLSKTLGIHHINYDKKLTIKENCCTLCNNCNSEVNFNRKHWTKFFQSLLNEKYDYIYENNKIILEVN